MIIDEYGNRVSEPDIPEAVIHTCQVCNKQVRLQLGLFVKCPECETHYNTLNHPMVVKTDKIINPSDLTPKKHAPLGESNVDRIIDGI